MAKEVHISECARRLGVHPQHLRMLEWQGRIPPARRDLNGRIYSEIDIELLRAMGVGSRPRKLKRPEEVLGASGCAEDRLLAAGWCHTGDRAGRARRYLFVLPAKAP